jgi:hypothetical protein
VAYREEYGIIDSLLPDFSSEEVKRLPENFDLIFDLGDVFFVFLEQRWQNVLRERLRTRDALTS